MQRVGSEQGILLLGSHTNGDDLRVMCIRLPRRSISFVRLVSPHFPPLTDAAREQLNIGTGAACLDNSVLLVRFARVLALPRSQQIHLASARPQCARVLALDAAQNQLSDIAKIETHDAAV